MTYRISADIKYLGGSLEGMIIPAGHHVTATTQQEAYRIACFLDKVHRNDDFIRAAVTGNCYQVVSAPEITEIHQDDITVEELYVEEITI